MAAPAWSATADRLRLHVRLTPKGGRDAIEGIAQDAAGRAVLKVRVSTPPHAGEANTAMVRLLARTLGVAASRVRITAGATARVKSIEIEGDGPALAAALARLAARDRG